MSLLGNLRDRAIESFIRKNEMVLRFGDIEEISIDSNVRTADGRYIPNPINVADVVLPKDIAELTEYIAENTHEEWAKQRIKEGWTFASKTNKKRKESFDLIPYCELLDSEKEYDRKMAMNTLRVLYKLGYKIEKAKQEEVLRI